MSWREATLTLGGPRHWEGAVLTQAERRVLRQMRGSFQIPQTTVGSQVATPGQGPVSTSHVCLRLAGPRLEAAPAGT